MHEEYASSGDFEVVYTYSTQDALDDGTLVDAATHPELCMVTLLNWNVDRIRIIVSSGLLAVLRQAGDIIADWQKLNRQFIRENSQRSSDFTELKLQIGSSQVTIWVGCEPFGAADPTPKLTFYLPEEH
jgi:hypothetical protein